VTAATFTVLTAGAVELGARLVLAAGASNDAPSTAMTVILLNTSMHRPALLHLPHKPIMPHRGHEGKFAAIVLEGPGDDPL
jgi:hypothetical protein